MVSYELSYLSKICKKIALLQSFFSHVKKMMKNDLEISFQVKRSEHMKRRQNRWHVVRCLMKDTMKACSRRYILVNISRSISLFTHTAWKFMPNYLG